MSNAPTNVSNYDAIQTTPKGGVKTYEQCTDQRERS